MRIVFDTNVYISGFLFRGGVPSRLLDLAQDRYFNLFTSSEILEELNRVLESKFQLSLHERNILLRWLEKWAEVVYPQKRINLVKRCDDDNRILECALAAQAEFLVTGDKKDLLTLKHRYKFNIISPGDFFRNILMK